MRSLFLLTLAGLICLSSCQKHDSPPPVTPTNPDSTTTRPSPPADSILSLKLYYPDAGGVMGTTYADSVPTVLPYPASPIYTLNAKQNNDFAVSFTQKPTLYTTGWQAGNISILISAPPDSVNLHPLDLINSLKSQMLATQSLSSLKLTNFGYYMVPGVDYNGYFLHECDPARVTAHPFPAVLYYDIVE